LYQIDLLDLIFVTIDTSKEIKYAGLRMKEDAMKKQEKFLFLRGDLVLLNKKRGDLLDKYNQAAQDSGEACRQSSETFHDNFPYEQAMRDMGLYSTMIAEIDKVMQNAMEIDFPVVVDQVTVGCNVRILDLNTDEYRWFQIGSYIVDVDVDNHGEDEGHPIIVSYNSPIGLSLLGKKVHDCVSFSPPKREVTILLVSSIVPLTPQRS